MSYDLEIRFDDDYSRAAPWTQVSRFLQECGAEKVDEHLFRIRKLNRKHHVEIDVIGIEDCREGSPSSPDPRGDVGALGIGIPYALLDTSGNEAFRVAFNLARQLGWRVYDPQVDRYLEEPDVAGRARNLVSRAAAADAVLEDDGRPEKGLMEEITRRVYQQNIVSLVLAFAIAAALSAGIFLWFDISWDEHDQLFIWSSVFLALLLLGAKVYLTLVLENRRRRASHGSGSSSET